MLCVDLPLLKDAFSLLLDDQLAILLRVLISKLYLVNVIHSEEQFVAVCLLDALIV